MFLRDVRQYATVTQDLLRYEIQKNTAPFLPKNYFASYSAWLTGGAAL